MQDLTGKVALVTGGSRGIGAAIARELAKQGADVAITYVSSPEKAEAVAKEIEGMGHLALAIKADSSDAQAVRDVVGRVASEFGRLDILVNNAGIAVTGAPEEMALEDIDRTLDVNVRAVYLASLEALKHMKSGGRIISIASCLAHRIPDPGITLYSMSKAALIGMTKGLARDVGARGITVNTVDPGPIDTDMNPADAEWADQQRSQVALGRYGEPEDIASMVAYLASDEARFITGASMAVDGGINA